MLTAGLKKYNSKAEVAKRKARPKNNKLARQSIANQKKNKLELWNPLSYRGLIYIFEVGKTKLPILRPKSPEKLILKTKKQPHFFLRLEADFLWL